MLTLCKTPRARGELAKSFKVRRRTVTRNVGKSMLRQELLRYGIPFDVLESTNVTNFLNHFSLPDLDRLYARLGEGSLQLRNVVENIKNILYGGVSPLVTPTGEFNKIELTTLDPVSVKFSSCCKPNPIAKDNCALLTNKGLSVHHKKCERFIKLGFQREEAVNITWKLRETNVRKPQSLLVPRATRKEIMQVVGTAPEELEMQDLEVLSRHDFPLQAWELTFKVVNLYGLQKVLRHFDRSNVQYEFYLEG